MTEVDRQPRGLLRDYARQVVQTTEVIVVSDLGSVPKHTIVGVSSDNERFNVGMRGELAGNAFVALQNVLDLLPEISEKNGVPHVAEKIADAIERAFR